MEVPLKRSFSDTSLNKSSKGELERRNYFNMKLKAQNKTMFGSLTSKSSSDTSIDQSNFNKSLKTKKDCLGFELYDDTFLRNF